MILSDLMIQEKINTKEILIAPFNEQLLQGTSYDLRLDNIFVNIVDNNKAKEEYFDTMRDRVDYVASLDDSFILPAKRRVLATTMEKAGSLSSTITTSIQAKSSWGRHGLEVCSCAGWGDPGYATHWTLEIFNKNEYAIKLEKGMVVAQIVFHECTPSSKSYKSKYNKNGANPYINLTTAERLELMIPKKISYFNPQ